MLGTSFDAPALGGVLKLVAQEQGGTMQPVMKHSTDKITEPGVHQVFRYDSGDVVALDEESLPGTRLVHPVMTHGRAIDSPALDDIRRRTRAQMPLLPEAVRRFDNPEPWPVRRSHKLDALREQMEAHV
jgi:nicotinate phosphoribosyltransferase